MTEEETYRQAHPKRNVAVVGVRDNARRVLLVRTHTLTEWWQPVGGGVDPEDETPHSAAAREIKEELGIDIRPTNLKLIIQTPYDFGEGVVYFYELEVEPAKTIFKIDGAEIIDYKWFSPEEAQHLRVFPATKAYLRTLV